MEANMKKPPKISVYVLIFFMICISFTTALSGCKNNRPDKETADIFTFIALEDKTYEVQANKAASLLQKIQIPSKHNGKSVTRIGDYAFANCKNITEITIPDTVKSIGSHAFWGCSSLTGIVVPDDVKTVGDHAFRDCTGLKSVTLPKNLNYIDKYIFKNCVELKKITIPEKVKSIGEYAFCDCAGLNSISIPESVRSIGEGAFDGCASLSGVYISDTEKWCGIEFSNTSANPLSTAHDLYLNGELVTDLIIPEGVVSLDNCSFAGCTSIKSVTIPDSMESVSKLAFSGCSELTGVYISDVSKWCGIKFRTASANPLSNAHNLYLNGELITDLIILEGVTNLDNYSFFGCSCIKSAVIPDSVTSIGEFEFYGCEGLTEITVPENVEYIGDNAFGSCGSLEKLTVTGGALLIESNAFTNCGSLAGVYITDVEKWCYVEFSDISANPLTAAHDLYLNGKLVTELIIPESVSNLYNCSFAGCTSIQSVTIPESVKRINGNIFSGCSGITKILVSGCESDIDFDTFGKCENLKYNEYENALYLGSESNPYIYLVKVIDNLVRDFEANENTAVICRQAFSGCGDLTSITVPESLQTIKLGAFFGCADLQQIVFAGTKKQWDDITKDGGWNQATGKYTVRCSDGELEKVESYIESEEDYGDDYDY